MTVANEQLFGIDEAARRLAIKPKTLRNWIAARRIGVFRIGRCVRISQSEIQKVLEESFIPSRREIA